MPYTRTRKWIIVSVSLVAVILVGSFLYARLYERKNESAVREEGRSAEPSVQSPVPPLTSADVVAQELDIQPPVASNTAMPDQNTCAVSPGAKSGTDLQERLVAEKMDLACKVLGIELDKDIRTEKTPPYNEYRIQVRSTTGDWLLFDPMDGTLLWFLRSSKNIKWHEGEETLLTAREAADRLMEFTKALGEPITVSEADAELVSGDEWHFHVRYDYKGVPVLDARLDAEISAVGGEIIQYSNHPFRVGVVDVTERVSMEEAIATATEFLEQRTQGESAGAIPEPGTKKWIVYPNDYWTPQEGEGLVRADQAKCCWVVRFRTKQWGLMIFFVDVGTGKIVGGFGG
ncbi:MAG: hypothetical protein GXY07_04680 [Candidatus Hydrogenedentes bacterium]|nr:hypothetical protein [Candidatus Hydrogenedentota bacterium]